VEAASTGRITWDSHMDMFLVFWSRLLCSRLMPLLSEPFVQVSVGPFTIVKSIDSLTEALADMLSAERKDFTLSSKNVGKMMGPLYLHAFRPLTFDAFVSLFL